MQSEGNPEAGKTQSTLVSTNVGNPNRTRQSAFFRPPRMSNQRLNSTIQFDDPPKADKENGAKFKPVDRISWKKWAVKGLPTLPPQLEMSIKRRAEKEVRTSDLKMGAEQIRLRNQLYELDKMRADVERARKNNQLITVIEQTREDRIEEFFRNIQTQVYGES